MNSAAPFEVGEEVYMLHSYGGSLSKETISRVTKTQAIISRFNGGEHRFNRETGRMVGEAAFSSWRISRPTENLDQEWAKAKLRNARANLSRATGADNPVAIRKAYAEWDALQRAVEEGTK